MPKKEPELSKSQQQRLDKITKKHLDYIDYFYDKDPPPKKTADNYRKPRQDIFLPEKKSKKKPRYKPGICEEPGCGVTFEKESGVQRHCKKHLKFPNKYVPVAKRDKNGGEF